MKQLIHTILSALCLFTLAANSQAVAGLVADPSFEQDPIDTQIGPTGVFNAAGQWTIDRGFIRGAENGITPLDGDQMLQFDMPGHQSTDIYQLIDVSALAGAIDAQTVTAELSAFFNATAAHDFSLRVVAYGDVTLPLNINTLPLGSNTRLPWFTSDANPDTWEQVSFEYAIPEATRYVAIGIHSVVDSNVFSYADQVSLGMSQIPEPGSLAVWLICGLGTTVAGLFTHRRRRRG